MNTEIENLRREIENLKNENYALKTSNESLNFLVDNLPAMISWVRRDLTYIAINKRLEEYLELHSIDIENKKIGSVIDKTSHFSEFIENFFKSDKKFDQIEISNHINNKIKYFLMYAQKYNNDNEAIIIGLDITERKLMEESLYHSDKLRTIAELSTSIVHEIKNPLSIIKGSSEILRTCFDEFEDDKKISLISKIEKTTDRVFTIIDGLKNLARDDQRDDFAATSINVMIEETLSLVKAKMNKENVIFSQTLNHPSSLKILCIEGQIIQILVNLINNSIEEMNKYDERWIKLSTEVCEDEIFISITDSGAKIDPEIVAKIFSPFFTTKPKGIGTGMGLSICQNLAVKNKGRLEYRDNNNHPQFNLIFPITVL